MIGFLANPKNPNNEGQSREALETARTTGQQMIVVGASTEGEIETAFEPSTNSGPPRLLSPPIRISLPNATEPLPSRRDMQFPRFTRTQGTPRLGGLITYGNRGPEAYHQLGLYTGKILKGAKPFDLPVVQATEFELVINLKTANRAASPPRPRRRGDRVRGTPALAGIPTGGGVASRD